VSEPTPDRRVDDLRQQLRALGYLDAGVDRFVLGPVRETRGPAAIALLASLRVGIIAAVLLGPAAAIGVSGRLPGLITGPRDAIVIALYMGALFGAAVSVAAFTASLTVAALAGERIVRSAGWLSRTAGSIVAVACLAYLTLWWRTANAGFGANAPFTWSAPVWTGFALAVAVGISLLLAHAVTVTAFAVIVAGRTPLSSSWSVFATATDRSWKMPVASGVIAFASAAALLIVTSPRAARDEPSPPLAVVSSGLRVRLVAIDGFDPAVFDALASDGRIPGLAAALSSTRARLVAAHHDVSRDPARAWTTIATGQHPEAHGVHGLETRRVAGVQGAVSSGEPSRLAGAIGTVTDLLRLTRPAVASGSERREKTVWEVASDAGLRTAVVNWWATWPAPAGAAPGIIILSDRATLRLERGGTLDAEIAPAAVYERLLPRWTAIRRDATGRAAAAWTSTPSADSDVRAVLQRSADLDAIQLTLMREVSTPPPDLAAVYLPGLDIAQHALLGSSDAAWAASAVAARVDAIRNYYVFLDRLLAETLRPAPGEVVILVTQPGRVAAAAEGLMGISGRLAAPGATATGRAPDVAPTVLQALGVPISRELAGSALTALFDPESVQRYPVRHVASYGRPSMRSAVRSGQPLDQEMIDRLRSLGYVR
jgi:hypothetical protein